MKTARAFKGPVEMCETAEIAREVPSPERLAEVVENIAIVCHEANRAYRLTIGEEQGPHWKDAPTEMQDSARDGVRRHLEALERGDYLTGEESHNLWLAFKLRDGWRYGSVKDTEQKIHPCLLPYSELPEEQKVKDTLFSQIVVALSP